MRLSNVILLCCGLVLTGCHNSKVYDRHVEPSYDATGQPRAGYVTLNREYMDALYADLVACYGHKQP